ncbi:MAG: hypothetical protein HFH41_08285 [Lachnospiraceae bacterium]|nr:hypothetical protein [Lachnospiraceae bacterium]
MKTRRVGSITCGILMIFFGILFLVHMVYPPLTFGVIMKLWPLILLALGGEMIASNMRRKEEQEEILRYDKGAIFLVILLTGFAACMGILEYCMNYFAQYGAL